MVVMVLLGACTNDDRTVAFPEAPTQHAATSFDIPVGGAPQHDILVVLDSSPAMAPYAERTTAQLATLFGQNTRRGDPDWHLAVITSDLGGPGCSERGDDGLFRIPGLVGAPFLIEWRHLDKRHTANYEGTLEDAFAQLASVGTAGCPTQQPLAAIRRALDEQPRNTGFRREGANLLVIIVSAGDDGSVDPVGDHAAFLRGIAPAWRLNVAGIYDRPATRLDELMAAFPHQTQVAALRAEDATSVLALPIQGGGTWGGARCIEGIVGPEPECSISDVLVEDDQPIHERVLPACDATASVLPCWRITTDPLNCPSWAFGTDQVLEVERRDYPPNGTHVRGNCVTK